MIARPSRPGSAVCLSGRLLLAWALGGGAGCGGTAPEAASASPDRQEPSAAASASLQANNLDALRSRLSAGVGSELNLAAKGFGPGLGPLLANSEALSAVSSLDVSDNDLGVEGARALAGSAHL